MEIFVDSANLGDIEEALERGFPSGITTNPSILANEQRADFVEHIGKIIGLLERYERRIPLSVEVFSRLPKEMLRQALEFVERFEYEALYIKIPIGWDELTVICELRKRGIKVNCTCCMSVNQAIMASRAGADFVSLFYGRIRDTGYSARSVVQEVHQLFQADGSLARIIVGSIRHICDVNEAFIAGADIVTVPPKFFKQMVSHPKTTEAVDQFLADFEQWQQLGSDAHPVSQLVQ